MFGKFQHRGFLCVKTVIVLVLFCTCVASGETVWIEREKITAPAGDVSVSASLSRSVSIGGVYAVVGSYGCDEKGVDSGAAYNLDLNCDGKVNNGDLVNFSNFWQQQSDRFNMVGLDIPAGQ